METESSPLPSAVLFLEPLSQRHPGFLRGASTNTLSLFIHFFTFCVGKKKRSGWCFWRCCLFGVIFVEARPSNSTLRSLMQGSSFQLIVLHAKGDVYRGSWLWGGNLQRVSTLLVYSRVLRGTISLLMVSLFYSCYIVQSFTNHIMIC